MAVGPGEELANLIELAGLSDLCRRCQFRADQMNAWGPSGCRERLAEISAWLRESFWKLDWRNKLKAAKALRPFVQSTRPIESLVELAIARAEIAAWNQSEISPSDALEFAARVPCRVVDAAHLAEELANTAAGNALQWIDDGRHDCRLPIEIVRVTGTPSCFAQPGGAYLDCRPAPRLPPIGKVCRIDQSAGFGDAVALSAVLRHLRHYHPRARLEVVTEPDRTALYSTSVPDPTLGRPLVDRILFRDTAAWCTHPLYPWPGHSRSFRGCPSTPVEHCLVDRLGLQPVRELCHYWVPGRVQGSGFRVQRSVENGLRAVPSALCHFAGEHRKPQKNLTLEQQSEVACQLRCAGYGVHVLGEDISASNAAELIDLIQSCDLFVGVDSGPLHMASALGKRAIGLWTYLSPLHCFCPDSTTHHLLWRGPAQDYERWRICRPVDDGLAFFRANYRYSWCDTFGEGMANALHS